MAYVEQPNYESNGYPEVELFEASKPITGSEKDQPKSTGYSTDIDQLTRAKRLLAQENRWKQSIKRGEISPTVLAGIIRRNIKDNFK